MSTPVNIPQPLVAPGIENESPRPIGNILDRPEGSSSEDPLEIKPMKRETAKAICFAMGVVSNGYDPSTFDIPEIAHKWMSEGVHPSLRIHHRPVAELLPYREYYWNESKCRPGPIEGVTDEIIECPERWKLLKQVMKAKGWEGKPLYFIIGKNGVAKVGNGNHRLNVASELKIKQVPVYIVCKDEVSFHGASPHEKFWHNPLLRSA